MADTPIKWFTELTTQRNAKARGTSFSSHFTTSAWFLFLFLTHFLRYDWFFLQINRGYRKRRKEKMCHWLESREKVWLSNSVIVPPVCHWLAWVKKATWLSPILLLLFAFRKHFFFLSRKWISYLKYFFPFPDDVLQLTGFEEILSRLLAFSLRHSATMMALMPSPITIPTDEDLQVCEIPNSVPDASPLSPSTHNFSSDQINQMHDYPFDFLPGEKSIEFAMDLTDGYVYLTTFRIFTYSNQSPHYSFINYPLRLIESIEIKDNVTLLFQCKDIRSFRLTFVSAEKCSFWWKKFTETILLPTTFEEIFAIKYASARAIDETPQPVKSDVIHLDSARLQLDQPPWRITEINRDYKLCTSYPQYSVVPSSMTEEEVLAVAKFRSYRRFPSVVWRWDSNAERRKKQRTCFLSSFAF